VLLWLAASVLTGLEFHRRTGPVGEGGRMTSMALPQPAPPSKAGRPSLRILAGLLAGVAVGLFFGEGAAVLQPVADLYIRGMQMTVLPYLVLTLVGGLGQLDPATARRLGLRAAALLGLLIALACAVIAVMPLAYPALVSASFYSDALIEPAQPFALGELYVPSNPFYAMANAIVPGLVLFSSAVGVALIGVPDKAPCWRVCARSSARWCGSRSSC
jgi:Na+/H+-dicarboxylate symporter